MNNILNEEIPKEAFDALTIAKRHTSSMYLRVPVLLLNHLRLLLWIDRSLS